MSKLAAKDKTLLCSWSALQRLSEAEVVICSAENVIALVWIIKSEHGLVIGVITLSSVDSDKWESLRWFQLRRMELTKQAELTRLNELARLTQRFRG